MVLAQVSQDFQLELQPSEGLVGAGLQAHSHDPYLEASVPLLVGF